MESYLERNESTGKGRRLPQTSGRDKAVLARNPEAVHRNIDAATVNQAVTYAPTSVLAFQKVLVALLHAAHGQLGGAVGARMPVNGSTVNTAASSPLRERTECAAVRRAASRTWRRVEVGIADAARRDDPLRSVIDRQRQRPGMGACPPCGRSGTGPGIDIAPSIRRPARAGRPTGARTRISNSHRHADAAPPAPAPRRNRLRHWPAASPPSGVWKKLSIAAMRGCSLLRNTGALTPRRSRQLLDRVDVEQRFGERFRAAAHMAAIRQDLGCALSLEQGETEHRESCGHPRLRHPPAHRATAMRNRTAGSVSSGMENCTWRIWRPSVSINCIARLALAWRTATDRPTAC